MGILRYKGHCWKFSALTSLCSLGVVGLPALQLFNGGHYRAVLRCVGGGQGHVLNGGPCPYSLVAYL